MIRRLFCLVAALALTACATKLPAVAVDDSGPRAQLEDSFTVQTESKADFFVVESLNGAKADNALSATYRANNGRGMALTPAGFSRPLAAEQLQRVELKGRTHYAAPILVMTGTVYQVKGVIEFVPKTDGKYAVRGELGEAYSAIWIEDLASHLPVGNKIEIKGSAKLGFFDK